MELAMLPIDSQAIVLNINYVYNVLHVFLDEKTQKIQESLKTMLIYHQNFYVSKNICIDILYNVFQTIKM
jgi:putative flippase GtrA